MNRHELVSKAYDRSAVLTVADAYYRSRVRVFTEQMVDEDIRDRGDITTESVLFGLAPETNAQLVAKQSGICAGIEEAAWFFETCGLQVMNLKADGSAVASGDTLLKVKGSFRDLLKTERVGLNMIQRMSGIASLTAELVERLKGTGLRVAGTRKTPWGSLDNKAVAVGGGLTHRLGLWDSILIKDNHLAVLRQNGFEDTYVEEAVGRAFRSGQGVAVEIEVQDADEAMRAAAAVSEAGKIDPDKIAIIMFDNFTPHDLGELLETVKTKFSSFPILFEASGNITPDNIAEYGQCGVDVVSLGYLTHSPKAFDVSQRHEFKAPHS